MTVTNSTRSVTYNGDGSTTVFAVNFYFIEEDDLVVTLVDASGTDNPQAITTDYTVSGAGNLAGGSVTMLAAPAAGEKLRIERVVDLLQQIDYVENTNFPAETQERGLDKLTMALQQQKGDIDRAPKFSETSGVTDKTFPSPDAGKVIGWNGAGDTLVNKTAADAGMTVFATQGEAEAGTADDLLMSPLRTKQAIDALQAVDTVFGRTGAVTAQAGDYDDGQITAAASATNYTPSAATVEGHLSGIDTALPTATDPFSKTYTPAYLAMTSRTLQAVLDGRPVTPMDFGATGHGLPGANRDTSPDDTTALQEALDFVHTTPEVKTLDLAGRTYTINVPLAPTATSFVTGKRFTNGIIQVRSTFPGGHIFDFSGTDGVGRRTSFDHLHLYGGVDGSLAEAAGAIKLPVGSGIGAANTVVILNNEMRAFTGSIIEGLAGSVVDVAATESLIAFNRIRGGHSDGNTSVRGIDWHGADTEIIGNIIFNCLENIRLHTGAISVIGNHLWNTAGVNLTNIRCDAARALVINDNYIDNGKLVIFDPDRTQINGNKFVAVASTLNQWITDGDSYISFHASAAGWVVRALSVQDNVFRNDNSAPVAIAPFVARGPGGFDNTQLHQTYVKDNAFDQLIEQRSTHPRKVVDFTAAAGSVAVDMVSDRFLGWPPILPTGVAQMNMSPNAAVNDITRSGSVFTVGFNQNPVDGRVILTATSNTNGE